MPAQAATQRELRDAVVEYITYFYPPSGAIFAWLPEAPTQLGALRRLADLYESQKDTAEAEACWVELVRANPGVASFHYQLGEFYQRADMKKNAKAAFEDAAALDPRPNKKMRKLR